MKVKLICKFCDKNFLREKSLIYTSNTFCSKECFRKSKPSMHKGGFWDNVEKGYLCWNWTGKKNHFGYGFFDKVEGESIAHRISFVLEHSRKIGVGNYICHRCDNPSCVRPDHLFEGTPIDNALDCAAKGRMPFVAYRNGKFIPLSRKRGLVIEDYFKKQIEAQTGTKIEDLKKGI